MSYVRLYPNKNATIFKDTLGSLTSTGSVNTGMNPIFELRDGGSNSKILLQFDLSSIKSLLEKYDYTCNLKLFDAGFQGGTLLGILKPIDVYFFKKDFVEGDGFSFTENKAISGYCNWNNRDINNDWTDCFNNIVKTYSLNHATEDILIENLQDYIEEARLENVNPNFALQLQSNTVSEDIKAKFIYSKYTRSIYKPYLEFYIDDIVSDNRDSIYATKPHKLHLLNLAGTDFLGTVTCKIVNVNGSLIEDAVVNNSNGGVYYIEYTPDISLANKRVYDIWSINGEVVKKNLVSIKSPNILSQMDLSGLYFYPATYYQHPIVNKGDKIKFNLISESRTQGIYVSENYEFRVVCSNGFELQPWHSVSIYNNKMYFIVDTSYFFEELEYEVLVRLKLNDRIQTSPSTYKFRVIYDGPSHLTNVAASPYDSRNIYLERNTN